MDPTVLRIFFALLLPLSSPALAADQSWLMSIPYAVSSANLYKVVIESIDDKAVASDVRYSLAAGDHKITVSLKLDVQWSPDLEERSGQTRHKLLIVATEPGKTYQIAARVDMGAAVESQLDDSYWEPFVYKILSD